MVDTLRYAFAITQGPSAGLACSGWRIWTNKEDTYITTKSVGGIWKASLHADASWRVALTKENEESADPMLQGGHKNAPWEFTPTSFTDGVRLAFVIVVTRGSLVPGLPGPKDTVIEVADRWDRITALYIHMTEPNVALEIGAARTLVGGPLPLASGRQVWVTTGEEGIEPIDPTPIPVGLMIQPVSPESALVTAPGYWVHGVHIG